MICGVRFCGGCNPRYERGDALEKIRKHFLGRVDFPYAEEDVVYDLLLVIGGCSSCCASHCQYEARGDRVIMWDQSHIEEVINKIESIITDQRREII